MARQRAMATISFRLPLEQVKTLKKKREYTRWIQALVIRELNRCPYCYQKLNEAESDVKNETAEK